MKLWIITAIIVGLLVVGAIAVNAFASAQQPSKTIASASSGCNSCNGQCTANNNCGKATCTAAKTGICNCGK